MKKVFVTLLAGLMLLTFTAIPAQSFEFCQTIPDAQVQPLLNAWAEQIGYSEQVRNPDFDRRAEEGPGNERFIDNPVTKAQAVRQFFADQHKAVLLNKAKRDAAKAAADATTVDTSGIQ